MVDESASEPTRHLPGTSGKLMVLTARASIGEPLFHPDDGRWASPGLGGRGRCLESILTRCQETADDTWCVPEGEEGPVVSEMQSAT